MTKGKYKKAADSRKVNELNQTIKTLRSKLLEQSKKCNILQNEMPAYNSMKERVKKLEIQLEEETSDKIVELEKRRKIEKEQYEAAIESISSLTAKMSENEGRLTTNDWDLLITIVGKENSIKFKEFSKTRNGRRLMTGKKGQLKNHMNMLEEAGFK